MTGKLLQSAIEWSSLLVGVHSNDTNLFDLDFSLYGHLLPPSWVKSLWQFAWEYSITLPIHHTLPNLQRDGDSFLTEQFATSGFKKEQLRRPLTNVGYICKSRHFQILSKALELTFVKECLTDTTPTTNNTSIHGLFNTSQMIKTGNFGAKPYEHATHEIALVASITH